MPTIGDTINRTALGLKGRSTMIWVACSTCGIERWTMRNPYLKTAPTNSCKKCACREGQKIGVKAPHKTECLCGRCRVTKGLLRGELNPRWKGGRGKVKQGYIVIQLQPQDDLYGMTHEGGRVLEHRLVMARSLGRLLFAFETVHHKNGIRDDNRMENLELWIGNHGKGIRVVDYHCLGCTCNKEHENG